MATLDGSKYKVENLKNRSDIVVTISDKKQSVAIFKCENTVVTIKGKFTNVSVDTCKKVAVIFDDLIGSVEVVNSHGTQLQANGSIPTITLDKSQGATIYLQTPGGQEGVSIITSNSTEVNVITPGKTEKDDPKEQSIPSQFITVFEKGTGKLVTKPTEHVGV